jgi:cell wall-associated NlpC family hydrolase
MKVIKKGIVKASLLMLLLSCGNLAFGSTVCDYQSSVRSDFITRDSLPQAQNDSYKGWWGPKAATYPSPSIPDGCDEILWKRARIIAVAEKYIGLPYRHHHIPSFDDGGGTGLDCSNFTSWVYNYGLGIKFNSNVEIQSQTAGRMLQENEKLQPGDLLFILKKDRSRISHVVIYIDDNHIIDSHKEGVQIREFKGWYKTHLAYARRIIE